ncbi:MAG TPA: TolC family protein [Flavipsychrobacter sp.]|nr:TolC family protein [Flavipsychrobacter sp.]
MRRYVYRLPLLIALLAFYSNAFSQESATPLSLQNALDFAVKNNIAVKNAQLDVLIQEAQNAQVTAAAYPRINGQAQGTVYIDPMQSFVPGEFIGQPGSFVPVQFTPKYASNAYISGSQLLFDGSVLVALQARKTIIELAKQNGKLTEEGIRYNVQKAYHSLVIAHKQFEILQTTLGNAREMSRDIHALHEAGFTEKIDVDRTDVQINNLASDSMRIANLLQVSEQLLKYQMGMDIKQPIVLTDTAIDGHVLQASTLAEQTLDYNQRTDFNLLNTQQRLNEYNLKRYRYAAYPSLSAMGNMGYNYATNYFNELFGSQYVWSSFVTLQLNVPIFNGFQRRNQVKEAKLAIEKTKNNIENLRRTVDFQSTSARSNLRNALLQAESQRRNVALAAGVLDLARRKYKEGVGSNLEVTQAQTDFLQSQNNYFNVLLNITNAEADLQQALGQFK